MQLRVLSLLFIIEFAHFVFPTHAYFLSPTDNPSVLAEYIIHRENFSTFPVTRMLRNLSSRNPKLRRALESVRTPPGVYVTASAVPVICTTRQREWARAAHDFLSDGHRQLPPPACPYLKSFSGTVSEHIRQLPTAAASVLAAQHVNFSVELQRHWRKFSLWRDNAVHFMYAFMRHSEIHECTANVNAVIEIGHPDRFPKRYFFAQLLSHALHVKDQRRRSLLEVISTNLTEPFLLRTDLRNDRAKCDRAECARITTGFEERSGPASFSHITAMEQHQVPWLDDTLDEDEKKFSAANSVLEDLTVSNIAILALPLVLCFIPISILADVSNAATLVYALITDLFSAVPIIIKGAELMIKFRNNAESTHSETWLFGDDNIRLSETWTTRSEIAITRGTGLVIVIVACWAIFLGFVTEFLAWRHVSYEKKQKRIFAGFRDRNNLRKVGLDTYQIRSKYLSKILGYKSPYDTNSPSAGKSHTFDCTSGNSIALDVSTDIEGVSATGNVARRGELSAADFRRCGRSGGAYVDDDHPVDALQTNQSVRSSRMSSLFLRNSTLSDNGEEQVAEPPFGAFLLGLFLGVLLPVFSYFYLHCLGGIERSRRKRKYYTAGCVLGCCLWPPILVGASYVYELANRGLVEK